MTTRGTEQRVTFPGDGAYTHYLELREKWAARFAVNVYAYVRGTQPDLNKIE